MQEGRGQGGAGLFGLRLFGLLLFGLLLFGLRPVSIPASRYLFGSGAWAARRASSSRAAAKRRTPGGAGRSDLGGQTAWGILLSHHRGSIIPSPTAASACER